MQFAHFSLQPVFHSLSKRDFLVAVCNDPAHIALEVQDDLQVQFIFELLFTLLQWCSKRNVCDFNDLRVSRYRNAKLAILEQTFKDTILLNWAQLSFSPFEILQLMNKRSILKMLKKTTRRNGIVKSCFNVGLECGALLNVKTGNPNGWASLSGYIFCLVGRRILIIP